MGRTEHGGGGRGDRNPNTEEPIAGSGTLSAEELVANRENSAAELPAHGFDDQYYRDRSPELEKITVPVLAATNWAHHLHTRGGFEGYRRAGSEQKWLEVHGLDTSAATTLVSGPDQPSYLLLP